MLPVINNSTIEIRQQLHTKYGLPLQLAEVHRAIKLLEQNVSQKGPEATLGNLLALQRIPNTSKDITVQAAIAIFYDDNLYYGAFEAIR